MPRDIATNEYIPPLSLENRTLRLKILSLQNTIAVWRQTCFNLTANRMFPEDCPQAVWKRINQEFSDVGKRIALEEKEQREAEVLEKRRRRQAARKDENQEQHYKVVKIGE